MGQATSEIDQMCPEPRGSHLSVVVDDKMLVWGGAVKEGEEFRYFSSEVVWAWNLAESFWTKRISTFEREEDLPRPSRGARISLVDKQQIYQFGGANYSSSPSRSEYLDALHKLDGRTLEWKQVSCKGDTPGGRHSCGMCVLGRQLAVMGGRFKRGTLKNDIWLFSLDKKSWSEVEVTGGKPYPRCGHSFTAIDENRAILIGGIDENGDAVNDAFMLYLSDAEWMEITLAPNKPILRSSHSAVFENLSQTRPRLFLFWGRERFKGKVVPSASMIDINTMEYTKIDMPDFHPSSAQSVCSVMIEGNVLHLLRFGGFYDSPSPGSPLDKLELDSNHPTRILKVDTNAPTIAVTKSLVRRQSEKDTSIDLEHQIGYDELEYDQESDFISAGSFGEVYKAAIKRENRIVALKIFCKRRRTISESDTLNKEVRILLGIVPYLHIVKFFGVCNSPRFYALAMEFVSGGDLAHLLASSNAKVENWRYRLDMSCQIAMGMSHLHGNSPSVIHLDLKSSNVLIKEIAGETKRPFICKICDFGMAKMSEVSSVTEDRSDGSSPGGTVAYIAPERYEAYGDGSKEEKREAAKKSDVFSYGVLLWEIKERTFPFEGMSKKIVQHKIRSGDKLPEGIVAAPNGFRRLIEACSAFDTRSRPSFATVVLCMINIKLLL
eukprot:m.40396 g.40396  ORF g.40396 m.40396 type:complete len:663 (+) comp32964_c0_seq1:147-2135(+)